MNRKDLTSAEWRHRINMRQWKDFNDEKQEKLRFEHFKLSIKLGIVPFKI